MLAIWKRFNQVRRKIAIALLIALVWIISLPATSAWADGYYSEKSHQVEAPQPYYSTKDRRLVTNKASKPYYTNKERHQEKAIRTQSGISDEIENGRRVKEKIPRDLESGRR